MYDGLSKEEKAPYVEESFEDHQRHIDAWELARTGPVSQKPEDRQRYAYRFATGIPQLYLTYFRCIEGLVKYMQDLLDLLVEYTGYKWTLLGGGPEPADAGRLNVIAYVGLLQYKFIS